MHDFKLVVLFASCCICLLISYNLAYDSGLIDELLFRALVEFIFHTSRLKKVNFRVFPEMEEKIDLMAL